MNCKHRILTWLLLLTSWSASGEVVTVCPDCPVRSVREGIALAENGDTVLVNGGHYREHNIVINKSITLLGRNQPVIDAALQGEILTIAADHVTIEGMTLKNVGTSYLEDRAAIRVRRSKDYTLIRNRIVNGFFGIYLEKASYGLVAENRIEGQAVEEMSSGNAIHMWYCNGITVEDNIVTGHRDGIYLEFVNESFIGCNVSAGHLRYGLHFMFSNDNVYTGNTFHHNGAGVAVMFSRRIQMLDNHFYENWGKASYGLLLKEIYDGEIRWNRFEKNTIGIFVEGSNRINYTGNSFRNNGWAINMSGGCMENRITENNFIANSFDLAVHSAMGDNSISRNYWSDYNGYDIDKDGLGDVPHRPVKLFNYIVNQSPDAVILLRSFFVGLINYSERVSPIFTPVQVADFSPMMNQNPTEP